MCCFALRRIHSSRRHGPASPFPPLPRGPETAEAWGAPCPPPASWDASVPKAGPKARVRGQEPGGSTQDSAALGAPGSQGRAQQRPRGVSLEAHRSHPACRPAHPRWGSGAFPGCQPRAARRHRAGGAGPRRPLLPGLAGGPRTMQTKCLSPLATSGLASACHIQTRLPTTQRRNSNVDQPGAHGPLAHHLPSPGAPGPLPAQQRLREHTQIIKTNSNHKG